MDVFDLGRSAHSDSSVVDSNMPLVEDMVADNRVAIVDFVHSVHHSVEVDDTEDNDSMEEGNMVDNQLEVDMPEVVMLQPDHV